MNYIMGVTSIKFKDYSLSHIGMLPDSFLMSFIGATIDAFVEIASVGIENNLTIFISTIVGTIVTFIGMVYVGYKSKQEFIKMKHEYKQTIKHEKDKQREKQKRKKQQLKEGEKNLDELNQIQISDAGINLPPNYQLVNASSTTATPLEVEVPTQSGQSSKHESKMSKTELVYE